MAKLFTDEELAELRRRHQQIKRELKQAAWRDTVLGLLTFLAALGLLWVWLWLPD